MKKDKLRTLLSFAVFALFIYGCWSGIMWIAHQPKADGIPAPLRSVLRTNEKIFKTVFSPQQQSKTFKPEQAQSRTRKNGLIGMETNIDVTQYCVVVIRHKGDTLRIGMDELKQLPKTEVIFDFKCIEGWSQVTRWGGVKFSDFAKHYRVGTKSGALISDQPGEDWYKYAGLETPNGKYYVGIDMPSMMHPQTILCYEVNGKPLSNLDGAPLRLIIPVKYGIKHLKRIGKIWFSDEPPRDYWAKYGYDYFAGL